LFPKKHKGVPEHLRRKPDNPDELRDHYITPNMHIGRGYHVRIGKVVSLYFNSRLYGSDKAAFEAAQSYRDEVLLLYSEGKHFYQGHMVPRRSNATGHVGISCVGDEAYVAHWVDEEGKNRKRWFSIRKYGREEAFQMALTARAEGVGGYPIDILNRIQTVTQRVRREHKILRLTKCSKQSPPTPTALPESGSCAPQSADP